ncbi:MAG: pyruvate formate lyase family protein, partial [Clostridia bacterium]|nr:pyruvate formate lyase family protein [Clostridia bacterium]
MEEGRLSRDEAKECLQSFFLMLQAKTPYNDHRHTKGAECHFAIGGLLPDGRDGFTDLSRLIAEAIVEMPMDIPEISLRWNAGTPREVLRFMLDLERKDTRKRIAFVNDEPRIKSFMEKAGMSFADACNYTMVGCNEPAFQGSIWMGGNTVNIVRCLTNLLYGEKEKVCASDSFDGFYALFEESLERDLNAAMKVADAFTRMRNKDENVISSLLMDGCIQSAVPANRGGCRLKIGGENLMGIVCLIDSLTVIRQFVFEEKKISMADLIANLESNWTKDPDMRTLILKTARFFGNNDALSDELSVRFTDSLYKLTKDKTLYNGEIIFYGTLA